MISDISSPSSINQKIKKRRRSLMHWNGSPPCLPVRAASRQVFSCAKKGRANGSLYPCPFPAPCSPFSLQDLIPQHHGWPFSLAHNAKLLILRLKKREFLSSISSKNIKPFSLYIPGKTISINYYAIHKFPAAPVGPNAINLSPSSRTCDPMASFWRKPESSLFKLFWTPASAGVTLRASEFPLS